MIYLGTNVQNVERALEAVRKEIEEVKRTGLTDDEFLRGKAQIKSAFVFGLETSIGNMNLLGKHALLTGEVADVEELIGKIDAVTPEDVRKAIDVNYDLSPQPFADMLIQSSAHSESECGIENFHGVERFVVIRR